MHRPTVRATLALLLVATIVAAPDVERSAFARALAQTATPTPTPTSTSGVGAIVTVVLVTLTSTNTPTLTTTPRGTRPPTNTATLVPGPDTYTVQLGDSLAKIAEKFGVRLFDLVTVNNLTLESLVYVGQILRIPPRPPTATAPPLTVPPGYTTYRVKEGDTLLPIARQFGVTVSQLRSANNLNSDSIFPGQVLLIPPPNTPTRTRTPLPPGAVTYVVQPGDQLLRLARRFGLTLSQLRSANGLASDTIAPGRVLFIPTPIPTSTPRPPTSTPTGNYIAYVVQPGDRLQRIAVWYGVTVSAIRAANNLSGDTISVGRTLTIPNPTRYPLRYTVGPSDNLTRIAARFETTIEALQIANAMGNNTTIFEGLILIVPAKP